MLTESETEWVWRDMLEAEVRSCYFGDLAATYSKRNQMLAFVIFFLSTGAAATLISEAPNWIPILLALVTAALSSYSIAVGLDKKAFAMSKLHSQWLRIASDYEHLWHHWYEENASQILRDISERSKHASENATTDAPYIPELMDRWADHVYSRYKKATV